MIFKHFPSLGFHSILNPLSASNLSIKITHSIHRVIFVTSTKMKISKFSLQVKRNPPFSLDQILSPVYLSPYQEWNLRLAALRQLLLHNVVLRHTTYTC